MNAILYIIVYARSAEKKMSLFEVCILYYVLYARSAKKILSLFEAPGPRAPGPGAPGPIARSAKRIFFRLPPRASRPSQLFLDYLREPPGRPPTTKNDSPDYRSHFPPAAMPGLPGTGYREILKSLSKDPTRTLKLPLLGKNA